MVCSEKTKARKFRVDGFTIEAFSCQLHMGAPDLVKPEEDPLQETAARNPSPPPHGNRPPAKSPSPGSASGTTQSASPEGRNPLGSAEGPDANPSEAADPSSRHGQVLLGRSSMGPVAAIPASGTSLQGQGPSATSREHVHGPGTALNGPDLRPNQGARPTLSANKSNGRASMADAGALGAKGDEDMHLSPPFLRAIKIEAEEDVRAEQAAAHAVQELSVAEWRIHAEEVAQSQQAHLQPSPHAQDAFKLTNSNHQHSNGRTAAASGSAGAILPPSSRTFTFTSQPLSHAQRLSPEPSGLSAAETEAQLFFTPHAPSPLAAALLPPKANVFAAHPSSSVTNAPNKAVSLQEQQHQRYRLYHQQMQQQQLLAKRHHSCQKLIHQQQRQQQQQWQQTAEASLQPQQPVESMAASGQGLWVPHLQKHLPVTGGLSAQHAQHAMHTSSSQSQGSLAAHLNDRASPVHAGAHHGFNQQQAQHLQHAQHPQQAQHAQHPQQAQHAQQPHQAQHAQQAQHAEHGLNGYSNSSVHVGQGTPGSGCSMSTAFMMWADGQYKARGQADKRAALRQFVQTARVSLAQMPNMLFSCVFLT